MCIGRWRDRRGGERTGEERRGVPVVPTPDAPLSQLLARLITENDPDHKPTTIGKWAVEETGCLDRRARPREGREPHPLVPVQLFWRKNIKSMPTSPREYARLHQTRWTNGRQEAEAVSRRCPCGGIQRRAQSDVIDSTATEGDRMTRQEWAGIAAEIQAYWLNPVPRIQLWRRGTPTLRI